MVSTRRSGLERTWLETTIDRVSGDYAKAQSIQDMVALHTLAGVPMKIDQQNPENLQTSLLVAAHSIRSAAGLIKEQQALIDELVEALWGMVTSFHAVEYMEDHMKQSSARARAAIEKVKGKP
jgi:hypothetical protein